ncbi:transposase [Pseudogracilibacillus sp. SO30301A]|uniref:transposase n=1 Tax=Pseudogracilibacillus sp. SO30301A TaxID=3098291 RepID=UPI00300E5E63
MITKVRPHDEYLVFISNQFELWGISKKFIQDFYFDLVVWLCLMDLTSTADLLKHRYSSNPRGRKPRNNPSDMLRSLLLMHKLQYTSVDKWVEALKTNPLYAILSGFEPDSTPGVGTFYDFFDQLWLAPSPHLMNRKKKKLKSQKRKGKRIKKWSLKTLELLKNLFAVHVNREKIIIRLKLMIHCNSYLNLCL